MITPLRHWIVVVIAYAAVLAVFAAVGAALYHGLVPGHREAAAAILAEGAPVLVGAALALFALVAVLASWYHAAHVAPARSLAEQAEVVLSVNPAHRIAVDSAGGIARVAVAMERMAARIRALRNDLEARAAEASARVEEERNRLATLMSELSQAVIVGNADGRILLYNERARALFARLLADAPIGLGRSVYGLVERDQVEHAIERLRQLIDAGHVHPDTRFVSHLAGGAAVRAQLAPTLDAEGAIAGLVFVFEDAAARADERRELASLRGFARDLRAPVANLRAAAASLAETPGMDAESRAGFVRILAEESEALGERLQVALRAEAALERSGELEAVRAIDLATLARQRIESTAGLAVTIGAIDPTLWLRVDSYGVVRALAALAERLRGALDLAALQMHAARQDGLAAVDLAWRGPPIAADELERWARAPIDPAGDPQATLAELLERHGAEIWVERAGEGALLRVLLPEGAAAIAAASGTPVAGAGDARPAYYDFALFERRSVTAAMEERPLAELHYTVFDTETTGLHPSEGDEIISIGAARIVNGRLLQNETFERLIDPRRPLDPASAKIHGITASALAGQPEIGQVLPLFHRFCEDTVLVAHNAAFDMRFLELKEAATGLRFDHPVLDTMLLAEIAQPGLGSVRMEAIADRLGVQVVGRHTALGDAIVTGEVFLRLVPLLAAVGICTLGEAIAASRRTYNARLKY